MPSSDQQLQQEFEKMRPGLEEMHKKDIEKRRKLGESDRAIGISQAHDLGTRSKNEYVLFCSISYVPLFDASWTFAHHESCCRQQRIQQLVDQVEKLALKVDIPLGPGPVPKPNDDV